MRFVAKLIIALAAAMALPAAAQEIPGRVGRVAHIEGSVALYQDPEEGWERAYVNSPFTSENSVWTDVGSRAELRVGGTALRLDEATQLDIGQLVYEELDAYVPRGTVSVRVRHYDRDERIAFTTPHARFLIRANGRYRVDVDPEREESRLTVFTGEARVGSDSGRVRVQSGQTVRIFGGAAPSYVVERAFNDPFDRWASARDERWVESRSVQYVSHYMTGYEDLDRYGEWREEPEFGALWFPTRVEADWAPYRYGRWDYVRPWGWTWVDDAPWGYAPFHYGRWVNVGNRWGWHPGARDVRPVWAPALVAFVGGANFSFGISTGGPSVGWYPLSPWDRYQPWYNASPTYVNQINIIVRNDRPQRDDRRRWQEYTRERGVTVVNRETLLERRPVQQAVVRVNPESIKQLAAANVTQPTQVLPTRQEVVQRRAATRTQAQQAQPGQAAQPTQQGQAAQPTQQGRPGTAATAAGVAAGAAAVAAARSAARPEFQRARQAPPQAAQAPEPAKTAPPPAQRVTVPNQTRQATQPAAREREAAAPGTREDATKAREAQQAEQRQRLEQQQKAREEQAKGREAQQAEQRQRAEQQQQARDEQAKAREAQQAEQRQRVEQQQQAREAQQRDQQKGREDAAKAREAQQAEQRQRVEQQQQQMREAQQRSQQQAQERAQQQQKAAQDRAQQQQKAAQERAAQPPQAQQRAPQQPQQAQQAQERAQQQQQQAQEKAQQAQQRAQQRREQVQERAKTREEQKKEKEEEEKKARGR